MNPNTEKSRKLRERRKKAGLMEVRGIWAPQWMHDNIKKWMAQVIAKAK